MATPTLHQYHGLGYTVETDEFTVQVWFPDTYSNDLGKTFQTRHEFSVSINVGWDGDDWKVCEFEKMDSANGCVAYIEQQTFVDVSELAELIDLVKAAK